MHENKIVYTNNSTAGRQERVNSTTTRQERVGKRGCIAKLISKQKTYLTKALQRKADSHNIHLTMKGEKDPSGQVRRGTKDTFWITTQKITKQRETTTSQVRYKTVRGGSIDNYYSVTRDKVQTNLVSSIVAAVMNKEEEINAMTTSSRQIYLNRVLNTINDTAMRSMKITTMTSIIITNERRTE